MRMRACVKAATFLAFICMLLRNSTSACGASGLPFTANIRHAEKRRQTAPDEQQPDPPTHVLLVQVVSESPQVLAAKEDVPVCLGVVLDGPAHVACSHTDMHAFRYQGTAGSAWIRMSIAWVHNRLLDTDRSSQVQPGTACTQESTSCHKSV